MNRLHARAVGTALALCCLVLVGGCSEDGSSSDSTGNDGTGSGRGGSTARMTIAGDYLYAIAGGDTVQLFDITQPNAPNPWTRVRIEQGLETLFPYGDYLLAGAEDGLYILDNTDPAAPYYLADFRHARARDPVVAAAGHAYVTLRSLDGGETVTDQLDVIDLSDIASPRLIDTIPMQGPAGLDIERDGERRLFVCDSIAGIKVFDTTEPAQLRVLGTIRDVDCRDVIVENGRLYAITDERLLQYDVTTLPARLLSEVSAEDPPN